MACRQDPPVRDYFGHTPWNRNSVASSRIGPSRNDLLAEEIIESSDRSDSMQCMPRSWPTHGHPRWMAWMLETPYSESSSMAGSQPLSLRRGRFAAVLALSFFTFAARARAQYPAPPLPPTGTPATSFADMVGSVPAPVATPAPMAVPGPTYYPAYAGAPTTPRVVLGCFDTVAESLFGTPDPNTWRPLPLSTFFSEGWDEAWVPSPNGSGGAPVKAGSTPWTVTCTGCGSSPSLRRSTAPRRAMPTSVPTRSWRR